MESRLLRHTVTSTALLSQIRGVLQRCSKWMRQHKEALGVLLFLLVVVVFIVCLFLIRPQPLFLTPYLEKGAIEEARKLSKVVNLTEANVTSYSGYLTVNKTYNSNLFFWFIPALTVDERAPVLLWLQGGPGTSSMFGLFVEHGPYVVSENMTVSMRNYTWTSKYSVLYIDSPVGTGFSFTDDGGFAQNQDDVVRDLYSALMQFFKMFPEYQSSDFYVTGESYAGKYVPAISYYIHQNNSTAKVKIKLKGMAIGGGFCDPEVMLGGYGEFLYQTGLIDEQQKQYVNKQTDLGVQFIQQQNWTEAFKVINRLVNDVESYPSFFHNATGCTNYFNYMRCQKPENYEYFKNFVTLPSVRLAIHVGNLAFNNGSDVEKHLLQDVMKSIKSWLGVLMDNYRVLIYSGQLDVIAAGPLTERFLLTVNWTGAAEYKTAPRFCWKLQPTDTEVAGYVIQVRKFYQVVIRGGGHILPYDQPARSFDMIDRFLSMQGWDQKADQCILTM